LATWRIVRMVPAFPTQVFFSMASPSPFLHAHRVTHCGPRRLSFSVLLAFTLASCGGGGGSAEAGLDSGAAAPAPGATTLPPAPGTTACTAATGRVLTVGPGKTYAVPSAAAAASRSGDVIKIDAGDYRGDVATWAASNLTICGEGGRARLFANGKNAAGKGIWVIQGSGITIDSVEFHDAKVPDQNGAGIRAEHGGLLWVRNSGFYDNENGILSSAGTMEILVEGSEFARNGYGDGYSHNIYVGNIDRFTVRNSYFHEAKVGHNLKSRAKETRVENSYFMDGPTGTSSYLADFSNGGKVFLRGNLFHQGPNTENSNAISFGAEGLSNPTNTLELVHNTVVNTRSGGYFLKIASATQSVKLTANLFAGTGGTTLIAGGYAAGNASQQGNVTSVASNIPGASSIASPNFWPNASLQAQIGMGSVLDTSYVSDSPTPYSQRAISGGARNAGALQAAP
jgi:hypothetical protein